MRVFIPRKAVIGLLLGTMLGCDTSVGVENQISEPETGAGGSWTIEPLAFQLNRVVDAGAGITEDIQAAIAGSLTLSERAGVLTGTGSCSWATRRHTARTGQTVEEAATEQFSVSGTITDTTVRLLLAGCAWNQIGYRGVFEGNSYTLSVPVSGEGPLFDAQVWAEARFVNGDNPAALRLTR